MDWKSISWFDGSGNKHSYEDVVKSVNTNKGSHEIHVGSDSQPLKDSTMFAVTVCLYRPSYGAFYFFTREKSKSVQYKNLGLRLQHESELAISLADMLRTDTGHQAITVHADVSPNPINKSFKYTSRIQNFIKSMGFKCIIKPDSWASWVADKHAK